MKKLFTVTFLVVALAGFASAQVPSPSDASPFSVYASGSYSLPSSGGFKDTYKAGISGSLGIGWKMGPGFQLIGKIERHSFAVDFDNISGLSAIAGIDGGTNNMWLFGVDGRYSLGLPAAPMKPYLLGGIGMANIKQTDYTSTDPLATSLLNSSIPNSSTNFYFNVGGGVELMSTPAFGFFAQIRYVNISVDGGSAGFIPISLGVKFF